MEWQLNPGSTVHAFSTPKLTDVITQVDYYLQRYDYNTVNAEVITGGGVMASTSIFSAIFNLRRETRITPAYTTSAAATFDADDGNNGANLNNITFNELGRHAARVPCTQAGTSWTARSGGYLIRDGGDTTWIQADARL